MGMRYWEKPDGSIEIFSMSPEPGDMWYLIDEEGQEIDTIKPSPSKQESGLRWWGLTWDSPNFLKNDGNT